MKNRVETPPALENGRMAGDVGPERVRWKDRRQWSDGGREQTKTAEGRRLLVMISHGV